MKKGTMIGIGVGTIGVAATGSIFYKASKIAEERIKAEEARLKKIEDNANSAKNILKDMASANESILESMITIQTETKAAKKDIAKLEKVVNDLTEKLTDNKEDNKEDEEVKDESTSDSNETENEEKKVEEKKVEEKKVEEKKVEEKKVEDKKVEDKKSEDKKKAKK